MASARAPCHVVEIFSIPELAPLMYSSYCPRGIANNRIHSSVCQEFLRYELSGRKNREKKKITPKWNVCGKVHRGGGFGIYFSTLESPLPLSPSNKPKDNRETMLSGSRFFVELIPRARGDRTSSRKNDDISKQVKSCRYNGATTTPSRTGTLSLLCATK